MSYDLDDIIEHYGVKGMKWGVRKQRLSDRKVDKKFIKNVISTSSRIAIYNNAANEQNNGGIERFNAKWKGKNLKDPQVNREYHMAYEKEFQKVLEKHAKQAGVTSPTGNFSVTYSYKNGGFLPDAIVVKNNPDVKDIKHSDTGDEVTYKIQRNLEGMIQSLTKEDTIEHYGVKGMKWGVRKDKSNTKTALQKVGKALGERNARKTAKQDAYHDKKMKSSKMYKLIYEGTPPMHSTKGRDRIRQRSAKAQYRSLQLNVASMVVGGALTAASSKKGRSIINTASNFVISGDAQKIGKNVLNTITGNPLRYVNAENMKNIVVDSGALGGG